MKKILVLILIVSFSSTKVKACDICGCGVGSYYVGILPEFSKKIIGMRYRYNFLRTHVGVGGIATYLTTNERYNTIELWGGWNISKRFRIIATVPYSFNEHANQGTTKEKNGLGDISLIGFFRLINSKKTIHNKLLIQSLFIGGGIKLPTGKYNPADKQNNNEAGNLFQLGTASVDYTLNTTYDIRVQDIGLNINASYKINQSNKYSYDYGNKLSTSAQLYYKFNAKKKMTIAPNLGILYENAAKDNDNGFTVDISGGNILFGNVGVESRFKKIIVGASWQTPLSQHLANGFVKANNKAMLHIAFML